MADAVFMENGQVLLNIHPPEQCAGRPCTVHNPSQHHMASWKAHWEDHYKIVLRECTHGVLHPDPDEVSFRRDRGRPWHLASLEHDCDCCCQPPVELQRKAISGSPELKDVLRQDFKGADKAFGDAVNDLQEASQRWLEARARLLELG